MHDGSQGNAMTEIALALAMGFFSILVLTMVSMGAGHGGGLRQLAGERQRAAVTGRSGRCAGPGCRRPSRFWRCLPASSSPARPTAPTRRTSSSSTRTATAEDDIQDVLAVLVRNAQADVLVVGKLRPSSHEPVVLSYKAVEVRDGTSLSGEYYCEFRQTVTIGGSIRRAYGVACQRPGGGWRIARQ